MESLPMEIVGNILSRLAVKNILQIRCVCKSWHKIISHPKFPKLHQSNNNINHNNHLFIFSDVSTLKSLSLNYENDVDDDETSVNFVVSELDFPIELHDDDEFIQILGCCNGLLCLGIGYDIVLWNPSIRRYKLLPVTYHSCFVFGFGYDSLSDDYKFVRAFIRSQSIVVVEVFSLKTNSWKCIEDHHFEFICWQSRNFLNGSLHWLAWKRLSRDAKAQIRLVAFSLAEERFVEVPLPDVDDGCVIREMCVFDGCLCVSGVDAVQSGVEIWVMKEYMVKSSWTKLCTILWDTIPGCRASCLPLCSLRDGDVLLEIDQICVVKYNMNEKNFSTVTNLESKDSVKALAYVESLISPSFDDVQQQHQLFWMNCLRE